MKWFQLMGAGIDVLPLRHALQLHPKLWDQHSERRELGGSPHAAVHDIWLRFQDLTQRDGRAICDDHECIFYPAWYQLPQAHALVYDLARRVEASRIGRVLITSLPPGARIEPHADSDPHSTYYERYHLVIQGLPGALFRADQEQVQMGTGECWWFQNAVEHEVINNSADDRIHLIVDLHL